jgi:hypothetical protein
MIFSSKLGALETIVSTASLTLIQNDIDFRPLQYQPLISACFFSAPAMQLFEFPGDMD